MSEAPPPPIGVKRTAKEAGLPDLEQLPEELDDDAVQQILDAADDLVVESVNASSLKRMLAQLEKKIRINQEMRIKFPDKPDKFLKSEVDLDEEVKKLKQLAAMPELLQEFRELGGIESLISLLNHANTDIAVEVLDVLGELTEFDTITESPDPEGFLQALLDASLASLSVETLVKINEHASEEDFQAVTNTLKVVENLTELKPKVVCDIYARVAKFVPWLLRRIRPSNKMDYNRLYAAEMLSILIQNSSYCVQLLGRREGLDGIDKLLRSVAVYRKRDPSSAEEEELMANLFDSLCYLMLVPDHRTSFGKSQGLELMIRFLKERKVACRYGLRLTSYALLDCPSNCQTFVEKMGLKPLFSIFMRKGVKAKASSAEEQMYDEHVTSIILSLCKSCTGVASARVLGKFAENHCEKLERLIELHEKYYQKGLRTTRKHDDETREIDEELEIDEEEEEYLDRCDRGLSVVQQVDNILIRLANMGNALIAQRVHILLDTKGVPISEIRDVITEYVQRLAPDAKKEADTTMELLKSVLHGMDSSNIDS